MCSIYNNKSNYSNKSAKFGSLNNHDRMYHNNNTSAIILCYHKDEN